MDNKAGLETKEEGNYLDPTLIREHLEEDKDISELPVIDILAEQIDMGRENLVKKNPDLTHYIQARVLAEAFCDEDLYRLTVNEPEHLPHAFEEIPKQKELRKTIRDINIAKRKLEKQRKELSFATENGWLWITGDMKFNTEENANYNDKIRYRIYLSPAAENIGNMLYAIGITIPKNTQYSMKTFDNTVNANEIRRIDNIVIYCTDENFDTIIKAISEVESKNSYLKGRPIPGGGTYSPMSGISFAKEFPGESGSMRVAEELEKRLAETSWRDLSKYVSSFEDKKILLDSNVWKLWKEIQEDSKETILSIANNYRSFKQILEEQDNESRKILENLFFETFVARLNNKVSPALGKNEQQINNILDSEVVIRKFGYETTERIKAMVNNPSQETQKVMNKIVIKTVLTMRITNALQDEEKASVGIRNALRK